ncbi:MAG: hypothetical protein FJ100_00945 [Deltaproteobacteria bacterium]|nr:hypothetical protein [Deltaproteobacteria bacterium]
MCAANRDSVIDRRTGRRLWLALLATLALGACGGGAPTDHAGWAGADALRAGRGAADAGASEDASSQPCATATDAAAEAAAEPPPTDGGAADTADATGDGPSTPDVPTFDVIAEFAGWDGGDLGTPAFDGAVFQELPPFADAQAEAAPEASGDSAADSVADPVAEGVDVAADVGVDAIASDMAEVLSETLADVAPEAGPEVADADAKADASAGEVGADAADGAIDSAVEVGADASDGGVDTAAEAVADGAVDGPAEGIADSAADAKADAGPETSIDASTDAVLDSQPESQGDGPTDAAQETADVAPTEDGGGLPCTAQSCDDGEPCTLDLCGMVGGCSHLALDDGDPCAEGTCQKALCSRNTPTTYGLSCKAIKAADPKAKSGVWWLDPDGPFTPISPFAAWCDMEGDGGGWTLLAKVATDKSELGYDAVHWTAIAALYPERPRFDDREARLTSYWALPFSQLRVGLKATKQTTWLVANVQASSLFHLIVQGKYVQLNVPEANWVGLLPGAQLLGGCRVQGFNAHPGVGSPFDYARARVGIVASAGPDCTAPHSRIGVGLGGSTCGQAAGLAAGGAAGCLGASPPANLPATGYLFAR